MVMPQSKSLTPGFSLGVKKRIVGFSHEIPNLKFNLPDLEKEVKELLQ